MPAFVRTQEIAHEVGTAGQFSLRVTSPDVEIRAVEGTVARVRIEYDVRAASEEEADEVLERAAFRVRTGEGLLEVSEPKANESGLTSIARALGFGGARVEGRVEAEIPAGTQLSYTGVSADLTVSGVTGAQDYRTVSGDLVLTDVAGRIRISGVSSDVSLRATDPIWLQANTVSGDLSAIAPRIEECRVITVSGDAEIDGALGDGSHHRVETVSGDLSLGLHGGLDLEVRGLSTDVSIGMDHRSEGSRDRRRYRIGDGRAQLMFSSMSGDVTVRPSRRMAPDLPEPPQPPSPPAPPAPPSISDEEQLRVLRALERGEIDVDEATRRLAGGGGPTDA
jgi:hypothetical protein